MINYPLISSGDDWCQIIMPCTRRLKDERIYKGHPEWDGYVSIAEILRKYIQDIEKMNLVSVDFRGTEAQYSFSIQGGRYWCLIKTSSTG